jgi:DNA replication ATP-dependent helicase Dna2
MSLSFPGFGESLLKWLADSHPDSIAQLTFQYRMHEEICKLSNDLVYSGTLKCANDTVRSQQLTLPNFGNKATQSEWLRRAVDPSIPVVFLDTDGVHSTSTPTDKVIVPEVALERTSARGEGGSIVNDTEAKLVSVVVDTLASAGLSPSSIGVVCPFRAQVRNNDRDSENLFLAYSRLTFCPLWLFCFSCAYLMDVIFFPA